MPNPTPAGPPQPTYSPEVQEAFDWAYTSGIDAERHPKYLHALIAAVHREVADRMARENVVLQDAAYQRGRTDERAKVLAEVRPRAADRLALVREQTRSRTLAEVRAAIEDMPSDQADCVPWLDVLAAIDALRLRDLSDIAEEP